MKNKQFSKPLTAKTGKDIRRLVAGNSETAVIAGHPAFAGEIEFTLSAIWTSLLGHANFSRHDDFFNVGGNSLKAVQMVSRISGQLHVDVRLTEIFYRQSILQLATFIEGLQSNNVSGSTMLQQRPELLPLSFSQERLWFIDQLQGTVPYHISAVLRLKGQVNIQALNDAIKTVVNRHEILRTVILSQDELVYQHINPKDQWALKITDGSVYSTDYPALLSFIQSAINLPFDLSKDHMLRADLVVINDAESVLVIAMHHIASDGWSMSVLVNEVAELYAANMEERPAHLPVLKVQYADYALWQRKQPVHDASDKKLIYWKDKLNGISPLQLYTDFTRPFQQSLRGSVIEFDIPADLSAAIHALCRQQGATLFMTLLATFKILLHNYSGQQDIVVGSPVANRTREEVENLIGFFVNTIALRSQVNGEDSFTELLHQLKTTTLEAYEHQEIPFEKVVEVVVKERDLSRTPLFQVMMIVQNTPVIPSLRLGELQLTTEQISFTSSKFDLTLSITETEDNIQGFFEYSTDLFRSETIERMIDHFKQLLASVVAAPQEQVGKLQMLTKAELKQLLNDFNNTQADYPKQQTIIDLFEEQIRVTPDNIALSFNEKNLTYNELNERVNQLAHYLRTKGVKEETLVPICVERSAEMVIGILGILKAGGAYVPIDPSYPDERIMYMLDDTAARLIVTDEASKIKLQGRAGIEIISLDGDAEKIAENNNLNLAISIAPNTLAYVIYTSGSTGRPKGVMIEHRNVHSFICWCVDEFASSRFDVVFASTSMCFDLSVYEMFYPLVIGKRIRVIKNGLEVGEYLNNEKNVLINTVPVVVGHLIKENINLNNISVINMAGEPIPAYVHEHLDADIFEIRNLYGPTEDTTYSTVFRLRNGMPVLIGKPINNTQVYILNPQQNLVPAGITGEICLGGTGLARGYLNRFELTAEKFISNPFDVKSETRLYRTGDLGRWLPDGNIEYFGRVDDQVKIQGYRIELAEIETVLLQNNFVSNAVVIAKKDAEGIKRLVGYIILKDNFSKEDVKKYLQERLPDYMVPQVWVQISAMPLTPNGKIDKAALPDPDINILAVDNYEAPRNPLETELTGIWQNLLTAERIGIHDNFFELGGHSLLATRMMFAIHRKLGIKLPVRSLFLHTTVAGLATYINEQGKSNLLPDIQLQNRPLHLPLSYGQERMWFIDKLEGSIQYHIPIVFRVKGKLNIDALLAAVQEIVNRHEILRTVFSEQNGQVHQQITDAGAWQLPATDGTAFLNDAAALQQYIRRLINLPFNLAKDAMLRAELISISRQENVLVLILHHIAADAWSMPVIVREFQELYNAYLNDRPLKLEPLPIQFADYAIWQRNYLQGNVLDKEIGYWQKKLTGVTPLILPTDYKRPVIQSVEGAVVSFSIDKEKMQQLKDLGRLQDTTLFMTLLAAFNVLLYRYSGQNDICIGTPIANRTQPELENLIGFFLNTLAIRSQADSDSSFIQLLQQVRSATLDAFEHQDVPFEKVVEVVVKDRDMSRSPLFQVMFVLLNQPYASLIKAGEAEFILEPYQQTTSRFDLTLFVEESDEDLKCAIEYSTALFAESTISKLADHFTLLLDSIVKQPQQNIGVLPILSSAEELQLVQEFNDTNAAYPEDKTVVNLFEEQVLLTPFATAVVFEEESFTYQQLNESANQLAHYLRDNGVIAGSLVPICIERSLAMIVTVVAVLKAGAVYVPVDPEYPAERISFMLKDTEANVIISSIGSRSKLPVIHGSRILEIDGIDQPNIFRQPQTNLSVITDADHLIYVIYTSGSTGWPKGVRMGGRGMVNLLNWQEQQFTNKHRRVLQFASLNFDVSFQEIFSTLCHGSCLYLVTDEQRRDMAELFKLFVKYELTHLFIPYIVLKNIAEYSLLFPFDKIVLEEIIVAGEQLKLTEDIQDFIQQKDIRLINQYGPTEAHVVTSYTIDTSEDVPLLPPIGQPIWNTSMYVLSELGEVVPMGVQGELYIGGVQVARGYLNRPELTAQKFIPDPFSKTPGASMYRTGDLGRWLKDGNLQYLGRSDDQVKIRGYRVELGEIESVLQSCPLVRQAVVLAPQESSSGGGRQLAAYVVAEGSFDKAAIIDYLGKLLPAYMVPQLWVALEQLPLTANGKIDRRQLPDATISGTASATQYTAPRNEQETVIATIWQELLGVERVGIDDNFFELGGHSLLAMRVVSALRHQLQAEVGVKELFLHPTVATLAASMSRQGNANINDINDSISHTVALLPALTVADPRPVHIPLSFSQERLWFIDQLKGSVQYHIPAILKLRGRPDKKALGKALYHIINRHEVLRTVFYEVDGKAYQQIREAEGWQLAVTDGQQYQHNKTGLQDWIAEQVRQPFKLSTDYLLRASLASISEEEHVLVVVMHHIASDGWSMSVIVKEVVALYRQYAGKEGDKAVAAALPILSVQYADYAIWQRNYLQGDLLDSKLNYWKNKLNNVATLELPLDYKRPAVQSTKGAHIRVDIDKELTQQLNSFSLQQGTTLFMTMLAAFKVLLHRYSGQEDICVGTPVAGRNQQEVESLIGFFINTLALRSDLSGNPSFTSLLQQVKTTTLEAYAHQDVPFEKVVEVAAGNERDTSRNPLFQVLLTMHNTPKVPDLQLGDVQLSGEDYELDTSQLDIICNIIETADGLQLSVAYCTDLFKKETITRMMAHFKQLLHAAVHSPQQSIGSLTMLSKEEQRQLLVAFNGTKTLDHHDQKTIISLFEEQVSKTPGNTAIVFEEQQLTYLQLNERANQLAHFLMAKGVVSEQLVPVCLERGIEMVIAIIGILKSGVAYVPIDPGYPQERIIYILDDTKATVVVSNKASSAKLPDNAILQVVLIDQLATDISKQETKNLPASVTSSQLAYIIYTSGSTGRPKGVMVSHGSLCSYLLNSQTRYINQPISAEKTHSDSAFTSGSYVHLSYTFDASLTAMFMPLLHGKSVVISSVYSTDVFEDNNLEKYAPYDFIKITPAHLPLLQPKLRTTNGSLLTKTLVIGGEALLPVHVNDLIEENLAITIINEYGPTEATVGCSVYRFNTLWDKEKISNKSSISSSISIGKPIDNVEIYILNESNALAPVGVMGELCIGGPGLAIGYLNQPELTAEKFISHPFSNEKGARLYKTGDLAKFLEDGNIEYLGRKDEQVKVRGYRVELGEIETVLQENPLVRQAVVIAKEYKEGIKRLIAYIVIANGQTYNREEIIAYLKNRLPEYMIPALFVEVENIPLTSNGKTDRKALPDPEAVTLPVSQFTTPHSEMEKALAGIWAELLDVEQVGIHDNFFELGGDSIIIIQIVSRARRAGYEFQVADMFTYQTIASLAAATQNKDHLTVASHGEQGILEGESGLVPIQRWYFEAGGSALSHFNQSLLLGIDKAIGEAELRIALHALTTQHDALRFVYSQSPTPAGSVEWQQSYGTNKGQLHTENLQSVAPDVLSTLITDTASRYQASLDIEKGELIRLVWMQTPADEQQNRLLLIIHHLAVDGVSWRILLEDLEAALSSVKRAEQINLGIKSSSYRQWYSALEQYSQSPTLQSQKAYWQKLSAAYVPLPAEQGRTVYTGPLTIKDTRYCSVALDEVQTKQLLQEVPKAYHTEINDLLLSALAVTLCSWAETAQIVIGMEGHGREAVGQATDTSRTVGWFTTIYPLLLQAGKEWNEGQVVKETKEQLRRVPDKGLGYGVLKYINNQEELQGKQSWEVVFNYLGQYDNVVKDNKWINKAAESSGTAISENHIVQEKLTITGSVQSGKLILNWGYNSIVYEAETISKLAGIYISTLEKIIAHCLAVLPSGQIFTPSDYGLGEEISNEELDAFLDETFEDQKRRDQVESIYRLSGLQQGMLFHGLYDNQVGAYVEQFTCDLISANTKYLVQSWQHVISKHSILRSGFYHDVFSLPVQCVYKELNVPVQEFDFSAMKGSQLNNAINEYEESDRKKGFDFKVAPLMRISLLKLSAERYKMLWTSHHILFDGWSLPVLMEEFLSTYESLVSGAATEYRQEDKYEDYIHFLERDDKAAAENYWRNYLLDVTQSTLLPFVAATPERTKGAGAYKSHTLRLNAAVTEQMQDYAQKHRLTINTLVQGIWSLLLHRYTGNNDVVFGVIVSGRPDELLDIEKRVGLYINTLPLRSSVSGEQQITEWLKLLQNQQVSSRQYQYTPLPHIQNWTSVQSDLFDSILIFENYPVNEVITSKQWSLGIENVHINEQTNYPLSIIVNNGNEINIEFRYNTSLLEDIHIKNIANHFEHVSQQIITNAEINVSDIELLNPAEKQLLLSGIDETEVSYPQDKTIVDLFEEQTIKTPDNIALSFEGQQLTYQQLNDRANQLAHYLKTKGVKEETLVPICVERSIEMVVGILGILKAGAAYVPIEPDSPADRIQFMLEDTAAKIVIANADSPIKTIITNDVDLIEIDSNWLNISSQPIHNLQTGLRPDNLAYIIYTSGSTGKPKAVLIEHRNVVRLFITDAPLFHFTEKDVWCMFHSFSFDFSVWEMFGALLFGGRLVMVPKNITRDVSGFAQLLINEQVTILNQTPSAFYGLQDYIIDKTVTLSIRYVIFGGEALNPARLQPWKTLYSACLLINMYGITETTVHVTYQEITWQQINSGKSVIGKPIPTLTTYILDKYQHLLPAGVAGELCIGGAGLARGYLNQPELTAQRFIKNPYSAEPGARLYRSGDLGIRLSDGTIEYLGRMDDQVKIRGYRIELAEIESILLQSEMVSQAVVLAKGDTSDSRKLVGYVVPSDLYNKESLVSYLGKKLPPYMVPSLWVELKSLPLTANGKINKKGLPDPDISALIESNYKAPESDLEKTLVEIWQELLAVERIGINDNFFALGGHSLTVIRMVSVLKKRLNLLVPVPVIFRFPTIYELANYLEWENGPEQEEDDKTEFELINI